MPELKSFYTVTGPLRHNGQDYAAGDPIELTDKHASPLLAVGAVELCETEEFEVDAPPVVPVEASTPKPKSGKKK